MNKTLVIYNPNANRGRNLLIAEELKEVTKTYAQNGSQYGADVTWMNTQYPLHATEIASQAAKDGYARVISIGGDGTFHEIANGLMQIPAADRPKLGIVPVGTGNDFVMGTKSSIPIEANSPRFAFQNAISRSPDESHLVDIGYVQVGGRPIHYWCNVVGIGFDAAVNLQSQRINWLKGQAMYFLAVVRTIIEDYAAPELTMVMDGVHLKQRVQMLTIGNGTREGGGFITTPQARPDDGVLDFAMCDPVSRLMMIRLIPEVLKGTHGRFRQIRIGILKNITINTNESDQLLVHADGETITGYDDSVKSIEVGLIPHALGLIY